MESEEGDINLEMSHILETNRSIFEEPLAALTDFKERDSVTTLWEGIGYLSSR